MSAAAGVAVVTGINEPDFVRSFPFSKVKSKRAREAPPFLG